MKQTTKSQKYYCDQVHLYAESIKSAKSIFIHGPDAFQRDRCFKSVIKILNISVNDGLNSFLFYGDDYAKEDKIGSIIETLNMFSFDLSERVISIRYFDKLTTPAVARIAKYIEDPCQYSKLIIVSDKVDARLSAYKTIIKNSFHIETKEMKYASHLLQWLNNYLRENNIRMDENAKNYFTSIVEPDAFTAYNEMKKLELFIGKTNVITINDIRNCTVNSKVFTVFDFIDAIGFRQKAKSLEIAENLIENDDSIIMIISLLTNFFFTLWKLDALRRKNISASELMSRYMNEINPYFKEKYLKFLNNYNQLQIQNAIRELFVCDSQAKLSMAPEMILLTALIFKILK